MRPALLVFLMMLMLLLSACSTPRTRPAAPASTPAPTPTGPAPAHLEDGPPPRPVDVSQVPDAVPRQEPKSRYGNPKSYEVYGERYYVMQSAENFVERGIASWYGSKFHGRRTSSGEPFDMYAMTAAHKELPLPSYLEVTNLKNGRKVIVKVNDRGPFKKSRVLDLSYAAAARLGVLAEGTAPVEIRSVGPGHSAAKPQAVTVATVPGGKVAYYIQAGAFTDPGNADRLRTRLDAASLGVPVEVDSAELVAGRLHRVRLGPLADVVAVDRLTESLTRIGIQDVHVMVAD